MIGQIIDGTLLLLWIAIVPCGPFWIPDLVGLT